MDSTATGTAAQFSRTASVGYGGITNPESSDLSLGGLKILKNMREGGMGKSRLEAVSDGVIAIIITIIVLELKIPHGENIQALSPLIPVFLGYALSFVYLGIYWNNHHHMLHVTQRVTGGILWANLYLLFWLSMIPFATGWMGENHYAATPTALYGVV